jgi:hypothetical protein
MRRAIVALVVGALVLLAIVAAMGWIGLLTIGGGR